MSMIINNADKIAVYFNTTQQHIFDVYMQVDSLQNQVWVWVWAIVFALTASTMLVLWYVRRNEWDAVSSAVIFGLVAGMCYIFIAALIAACYLDSIPIVSEQNMWYEYIKTIVGASR